MEIKGGIVLVLKYLLDLNACQLRRKNPTYRMTARYKSGSPTAGLIALGSFPI